MGSALVGLVDRLMTGAVSALVGLVDRLMTGAVSAGDKLRDCCRLVGDKLRVRVDRVREIGRFQ